jgi:hypothetical protein
MKHHFLAGILALASMPLLAAAPVAEIQSMLAKPKVMCGRFDQSKQLTGLKKPLASNGRFCIVDGKGVLWRTLAPFPGSLRVTRDEIVQMQGDRVAFRLDAKQEPTVRVINGVLFSLLAGDLKQLESTFEVDGNVRDSSWNVSLRAREPGLAKVIGNIAIEGGAYVSKISIQEASGDRTNISFSGIATGDAALTEEDAKSFQ